jgi:hypothetical protein
MQLRQLRPTLRVMQRQDLERLRDRFNACP